MHFFVLMQVELYCFGDVMEERSCTLENIKQKFFGEEVSQIVVP